MRIRRKREQRAADGDKADGRTAERKYSKWLWKIKLNKYQTIEWTIKYVYAMHGERLCGDGLGENILVSWHGRVSGLSVYIQRTDWNAFIRIIIIKGFAAFNGSFANTIHQFIDRYTINVRRIYGMLGEWMRWVSYASLMVCRLCQLRWQPNGACVHCRPLTI